MSVINRVFTHFRKSDCETAEDPLAPFLTIGPVSLFTTLCLAMHYGSNLDLAIAVAIGMVLSFSLALRGLAYSLGLLFLSALSKHLFFLDQHFWQLGIECSVAIGFAICAIAAELLHAKEETLDAKLETQSRALSHLEEDVARIRDEGLDEKMVLQTRLAELQKEVDETDSEIASLQILNDVLRKSALKKESPELEIAEKDKRISELLHEIERQSNLTVPDVNFLQEENAKLLEELNMARIEREQTYLINETLVRMHASSDRRSKGTEALQEQHEQHLRQIETELQQSRLKIADLIDQRSVAVEEEKSQWAERLSERDRTIALFQERVCDLSETQALYFQLKKQFEEKTKILHQTRKELFRTETALQAVQREQKWEVMEFPLFETILSSQVTQLESEKLFLETENADLEEIIGLLSKPIKAVKKTKTAKKTIS